MAINWQPLDFSHAANTHLPTLLVSAAFQNDSYAIHLTDLMHIWSESLTHPAILQRSEEENTSIDPSDGDQLIILLEKIKLGIQGGAGTTLALSIGPESGLRPTIKLDIEVQLPGGIAPLEWPIRLEAAPQSLLTSQLIVPLLQAQHSRMRETAGLAEVLKEKDHVIQKLMDKLEQQGADLAQVFPQVAAKGGRKVDRKKAEEKIRGLGPFQMEGWRRDFDVENARDTAQLVKDVFTVDGILALGIESNISTAPGDEDWWKHTKGSTINLSSGTSTSHATVLPKPSLKRKASTKSNDEFQVQATPPQSLFPKAIPQQIPVDDSTDDEDLGASVSQRSKISDSFPPPQPTPLLSISPPRPTKKLGKIGRKKEIPVPEPPPASAGNDDSTEDEEAVSPPSKPAPKNRPASPLPEPAPPPKPKRGLGKIGGKKKEATPPPPSTPTPTREPSPPLPIRESPILKKPKLGKIGGKKKEPTPPPPEPELEAEVSPPSPQIIPRGPKKKLGAVGGDRHKATASQQTGSQAPVEEETDAQERGRSPRAKQEEKEETPPPRETSEERADKKRRELKKELEAKAKAPVKKKRKF